MARTLSQDPRDRVVAAIDGGMSCRAAAAHFGVGASRAIRWRQRALEHGRAVAKSRGGDRHLGKTEAHAGFVRALIAAQGDMTLGEVQARLIERHTAVGISTVHRFFAGTRSRAKKMARDALGRDVGRGALVLDQVADVIGIVGLIGQHDGVWAEVIEQAISDLPVMCLPGGQAEPDREALRLDDDVDLGREPAA